MGWVRCSREEITLNGRQSLKRMRKCVRRSRLVSGQEVTGSSPLKAILSFMKDKTKSPAKKVRRDT